MPVTVRLLALIGAALVTAPGVSGQEPTPYDARAGVTLMRAINTAENAQRRGAGGGRYVGLDQLVSHPMMGKVAMNVIVNGTEATYLGQKVRLIVTADGQQYQAAIVGTTACSPAFFTDEGGYIYSGKVLDCP